MKAAKKSYFVSGPATERGERGVTARPLRKENTMYDIHSVLLPDISNTVRTVLLILGRFIK